MVVCVGYDQVNAYDTDRVWGSVCVCVEDLCQCLDTREPALAPPVVYSGPVEGV